MARTATALPPDFPKLGGQHRDYLAKALRDYKSGQRKNPIMAGFAQALSKQDIENLAAYYARSRRWSRRSTDGQDCRARQAT